MAIRLHNQNKAEKGSRVSIRFRSISVGIGHPSQNFLQNVTVQSF